MQALLDAGAAFLDVIYPPACPGCGDHVSSRALCCDRCTRGLPWLAKPLCSICGIPLHATAGICHTCLQRNPAFRAGRSALAYDPLVRQVIVAWKYRGTRAYGPLARDWMRTFASNLPPRRYSSLDALLPIPLYPKRLRWRGFNQSTELALALGEVFELPVWQGALMRIRDTPPQQRVAAQAERWRNLEGAFYCVDAAAVRGKAICLVDDVATTGATLHAAALELRRAGARSVTFLTLARQLPHRPAHRSSDNEGPVLAHRAPARD